MLLGAAACGFGGDDASPADTEPLVYELDGMTVVVNPSLRMADSTAWWLDTTAAVRIGVVDGPEEYMIGRLAGVLRRPDGGILLADAIAHELREYDAGGRFIRRVGRAGEGPGEYGWLTQLMPYAGDSIIVMDNESSRANVLDGDLGFVRRFRPRLRETVARQGMTSHRLIGFFDDGTAVVSDYLNVCGPRRFEGFCEDSVAFFRVGEDGATLARFGRFVYSRAQSVRLQGRNFLNVEPHPQAYWTVHGGRFYYADAKRFEVRVFRADGMLDRVIRVDASAPVHTRREVEPRPPGPTGDPERDELRRLAIEAFSQMQPPDTLPHFSDMLVDATGHVWLREYVPPRRIDVWPRWYIFDPEGRLRFSIRSPPELVHPARAYSPLRPRIGDDHVLTYARDEDGVESVVLIPLRKRQH